MTGNVGCASLCPILGSPQSERWVRKTGDRGGQDKTRKVRAVGRGEDDSNFNRSPQVEQDHVHLAIVGNALFAVGFPHFMGAK
jgi:hypothetical protein